MGRRGRRVRPSGPVRASWGEGLRLPTPRAVLPSLNPGRWGSWWGMGRSGSAGGVPSSTAAAGPPTVHGERRLGLPPQRPRMQGGLSVCAGALERHFIYRSRFHPCRIATLLLSSPDISRHGWVYLLRGAGKWRRRRTQTAHGPIPRTGGADLEARVGRL